jgi:hypothetical protein
MTKEEFKEELKRHKFNSCLDFLNFVEEYQKMSAADKYFIAKEEYDAYHSKEESEDNV